MILLVKAAKVSKEGPNDGFPHTSAICREMNMSLTHVVSLINFSRAFMVIHNRPVPRERWFHTSLF